MKGLIDTHFHLDMYKNYDAIFQLIQDEKQYTLCMTNSPGIYQSCMDMFPKNKYVKFALGFHPLCEELKEREFEQFLCLVDNIDYVGEVGLDFSKKKSMNEKMQISCFERIVKKCSEQNKLMSIHIRGAEAEALEILRKYRPKKCIIHWYSGPEDLVKEFIEIGCYFSINANMIKGGIINSIVNDRILIESDGPYSKVNGKKYFPDLLFEEYQVISKALNDPNLIQHVWNNFRDILMK